MEATYPAPVAEQRSPEQTGPVVGRQGRSPAATSATLVLVVLLGVAAAGCPSSSDDTGRTTLNAVPGSRSTDSGAAPSETTATPPPVPAGGTDCGTFNALSGWPTTTVSPPGAYDCITQAVASGTPARLVMITAGSGTSGKTGDGYDLPTHRIVTWVVTGRDRFEQHTDLTEDGGRLTVELCTGLASGTPVAAPVPTGCTPR